MHPPQSANPRRHSIVIGMLGSVPLARLEAATLSDKAALPVGLRLNGPET